MKGSFVTSAISISFVLIFILACRSGGNSDLSGGESLTPSERRSASESDRKAGETAANDSDSYGEAIRSTQIIEDFRQNKQIANDKYKGKIVLIRGKITNINNVFGAKALNLRDSEDAAGLQCYLADERDAEKVSVGNEIVLRGKVRGDATNSIDNSVLLQVSDKIQHSTSYFPTEISRNCPRADKR